MKKYKGVTQLSLEYSDKMISELVDISSLDARRLVAKAYCAGYECARRRYFRRISKVFDLGLPDMDVIKKHLINEP